MAHVEHVHMWLNKKKQDIVPLLPVFVLHADLFLPNAGAKTPNDYFHSMIFLADSLIALNQFGFRIVLLLPSWLSVEKFYTSIQENSKKKELFRMLCTVNMIVSHKNGEDTIKIVCNAFKVAKEQLIVLTRRSQCIIPSKGLIHCTVSWKNNFKSADFLWGLGRWRKLHLEYRNLIGAIYRPLSRQIIGYRNPIPFLPANVFQNIPLFHKVNTNLDHVWVSSRCKSIHLEKFTCEFSKEHPIYYYVADADADADVDGHFPCPLCKDNLYNYALQHGYTILGTRDVYVMKDASSRKMYNICCPSGHSSLQPLGCMGAHAHTILCPTCRKIKKEEDEARQKKMDEVKKQEADERKRQEIRRKKIEDEVKKQAAEERKRQDEERQRFKRDFRNNFFKNGGYYGNFFNFDNLNNDYGFQEEKKVATPQFFIDTALVNFTATLQDFKNAIDWMFLYKKSPNICLCLNNVLQVDKKLVAKHYRRLAMLVHPDKNKITKSTDAFKILLSAYNDISLRY